MINWDWQVKKCWEKSVLRGCRLPQRMRDRVRDKVACVMCLSRWSGMSQNMWPGHNPDSPNCQSWLIPRLLFSLSRGELPELFTWCYAAKGAHGIVMRKPILWFIHDSRNMKHTNMLYLFFYISMHFNKNIYKSVIFCYLPKIHFPYNVLHTKVQTRRIAYLTNLLEQQCWAKTWKIILITSIWFLKRVFMQKSRKLQVYNPQRKSIPKHMDLRGRKHPLSFKVL